MKVFIINGLCDYNPSDYLCSFKTKEEALKFKSFLEGNTNRNIFPKGKYWIWFGYDGYELIEDEVLEKFDYSNLDHEE